MGYYCCFRVLKEQAFIWLLQKLPNRRLFLMENKKNVESFIRNIWLLQKLPNRPLFLMENKKNVESFTRNMFIVKKNECTYTLFYKQPIFQRRVKCFLSYTLFLFIENMFLRKRLWVCRFFRENTSL